MPIGSVSGLNVVPEYPPVGGLSGDEPAIRYMPRMANTECTPTLARHGSGVWATSLLNCFTDLIHRLGMRHPKSSGMRVAPTVTPSLRFVPLHRREHSALLGQNSKYL